MSIGLLFWLIFVIAILFGGFANWPKSPEDRFRFGSVGIFAVLIFLLGWRVFGFVVQG